MPPHNELLQKLKHAQEHALTLHTALSDIIADLESMNINQSSESSVDAGSNRHDIIHRLKDLIEPLTERQGHKFGTSPNAAGFTFGDHVKVKTGRSYMRIRGRSSNTYLVRNTGYIIGHTPNCVYVVLGDLNNGADMLEVKRKENKNVTLIN